ncbi:protein cbg00277 [Nannochloropsis oceanica]
MPAPNSDPKFGDLGSHRFCNPDRPLFADLEGILATLRGDEGANKRVNARVLNVKTQPGAKAVLEEILDEKTCMTLTTAKALGRDPDLLLLRHQFLVNIGLIPNKQPICHCDSAYPKKMRPVNLRTKDGSAKQMQAALGVRDLKAACAAKAKRMKNLKSLYDRAKVLFERASRARRPELKAQYATQAAALHSQAGKGINSVAKDLDQDAPAAGGVVEITHGPEPATKYGSTKRSKVSTVFKCSRCQKKLTAVHHSVLENRNFQDIFLAFVVEWMAGRVGCEWLANEYGCSKNTPTEIFDMFRQVASWVVIGPLHPACRRGESHFKMGGPGLCVEIDEAKFAKRKYGRGRRGAAQRKGWVLGAVLRKKPQAKRTQGLCIFRPIFHGRRDKSTVMRFIRKYVRRGTHIMTDEARCYAGLRREGYLHSTVNHSRGQFVVYGSDDPRVRASRIVHTQTIEGTWKWARAKGIPVCGIKGKDLHYNRRLAEVCYMRLLQNHPKWEHKDPVKIFLKHLAAWYNAGQPDVAKEM